ncbi:MAG: hypothetical protein J6M47_01575 [Clostridia bacterium]|nr:hypothetical protein [Clostridia bacterium]
MKHTAQPSVMRIPQPVMAALLLFPAVALGVAAMIAGGVSPALWGQQIAAWAIFALLAEPMRRMAARLPDGVKAGLLLLFLAATLADASAGGAKRWIDLGVFNVNAAQLVLPALLVILCRAGNPFPAVLITTAVLCLQPDLSQLAAFSAAALPLLWLRQKDRFWALFSLAALAALLVVCAFSPVTLEPLSYSEGILSMLGGRSPLLCAAGWLALAAIPACGLYAFLRRGALPSLCAAVYYAALLLFVLTGAYPVPFMGFGLSPIVGYYLAYACRKPAAD